MKKFVNNPKEFVPEMLKGIALANPGKVKYVSDYNLIMRADAPNDDKVSIIQGSGSGHEPAHVMIVGKGMLDGACPGDVFAAPPIDYVIESSKLLNSGKGVLHIVNNYTGDRAAFRDAAEELEDEGITVKTIFVDDDVAVKDSLYTVGRRGVAGNFFVIKAVGAAAETGASLDELVALGNQVNDVMVLIISPFLRLGKINNISTLNNIVIFTLFRFFIIIIFIIFIILKCPFKLIIK